MTKMTKMTRTIKDDFPALQDKKVVYVEIRGDKYYYNEEGQLHRDGDLPAIERKNGSEEYYKNGKRHRDGDLPALIIRAVVVGKGKGFGYEAVEFLSGYQAWYKDGELHRDGGKPAVISEDGDKMYFDNGKLHNEDAAAIQRAGGIRLYFVHGKQLSLEAFLDYQFAPKSKVAKAENLLKK